MTSRCHDWKSRKILLFFREGDVVCKWLWWILFLHYVTTFYSTPFFIFKKNFGINVKHRKCITITFNDRIFFFQRYGIISIFWHCFLQCIIYWTIDEDQYCLYKKNTDIFLFSMIKIYSTNSQRYNLYNVHRKTVDIWICMCYLRRVCVSICNAFDVYKSIIWR